VCLGTKERPRVALRRRSSCTPRSAGMSGRGCRLARSSASTGVIDEILKADLDAPRKQRHTVTRIWQRLIDEHQMAGVSYPGVRAYVAGRKPQIRVLGGVPFGNAVRLAAALSCCTA
jgi:hypothetical protein